MPQIARSKCSLSRDGLTFALDGVGGRDSLLRTHAIVQVAELHRKVPPPRRRTVGLTDLTLSCAAKAHVPKAERRGGCRE